MFAYGSVLEPVSLSFSLPLKPVDDNPEESLNAELARTHPGFRRITSRSSNEFFELLPARGRCMEVGVGYGNYSKLIWDHLEPAELHLMDCWREIEGTSDRYSQANLDDAYRGTIEKFEAFGHRVQVHQGLSGELLGTLDKGSFDFIYIDADHTEAGCYRDLVAASALVRDGGFIGGHDYTRHPNAADGQVPRMNYGVIEAVNRFCAQSQWELRVLTIEVVGWCFPSYLLQRA